MKIRYAVFVFVLFISCRKDQFYPFPWVVKGNKITFNYISKYDSVPGALVLEVATTEDSDQLMFKYSYPHWGGVSSLQSVGESYNSS